jgi:hypothetical protein
VKFFTFQASSFARKSWFYFFRAQEQDDLFILSSRSSLFMEHDRFFATTPMTAPMIATVGRTLLPANAASDVLLKKLLGGDAPVHPHRHGRPGHFVPGGVPAIHVFDTFAFPKRGCPAQGRA